MLVLVGLTLAFLLGMAFARTLDERPKSSGTETSVRTLTPLPQDAPHGRTVTVTGHGVEPLELRALRWLRAGPRG